MAKYHLIMAIPHGTSKPYTVDDIELVFGDYSLQAARFEMVAEGHNYSHVQRLIASNGDQTTIEATINNYKNGLIERRAAFIRSAK
jgi:hypothetical protein